MRAGWQFRFFFNKVEKNDREKRVFFKKIEKSLSPVPLSYPHHYAQKKHKKPTYFLGGNFIYIASNQRF